MSRSQHLEGDWWADTSLVWTPGFRPSNGTERRIFMAGFCDRCIHDEASRRDEPESGCPLILRSLQGEHLVEWEEAQIPGRFIARCTQFVEEGS